MYLILILVPRHGIYYLNWFMAKCLLFLGKNCIFSLSNRPSADLKKPHTISKIIFVSGSYESLKLLKDLISNGLFRWYIFMSTDYGHPMKA